MEKSNDDWLKFVSAARIQSYVLSRIPVTGDINTCAMTPKISFRHVWCSLPGSQCQSHGIQLHLEPLFVVKSNSLASTLMTSSCFACWYGNTVCLADSVWPCGCTFTLKQKMEILDWYNKGQKTSDCPKEVDGSEVVCMEERRGSSRCGRLVKCEKGSVCMCLWRTHE